MKRIAWLSLFLAVIVLSASACSSKKEEVKQIENNVKEKIVLGEEKIVSDESLNNCSFEKISFEYPKNWSECTKTQNGLSFKTDYDKYQVNLILSLTETTSEEYNNNIQYSFNNTKLNNNEGEFFEEAQGGSLMGGFISLNNNYYKFSFDIISNQPVPENLDGVWSPENDVNKDVLLSILKSSRINY